MDRDALTHHMLADPARLEALVAPLAQADVAALVDHLKAEADRHWWINANRSLELAGLIVRIGRLRDNPWQVALGTMARGDALKFVGRREEAWALLGEAGRLFQQAGDEVGWARTRIGRLLICTDLNRVAEALADAQQARDLLTRHGVYEKLLVLDLNTAIVYKRLGNQSRALEIYQAALATTAALGDAGQPWLGPLHTNIGNVYDLLGDLRQAAAYHQQARALFARRNETRGVALADFNSAHIAMAQGQYRRALQLLHHARDLYQAEQLDLDTTHVNRDIVECYVLLNRFAEARDLAQQVITVYRAIGSSYSEALTLLHLATAEAELAHVEAARSALEAAEPIFTALGATAWVATTQLRRGRAALRQGEYAAAEHAAATAAAYFESNGQQVDHASALLLRGQARLARADLPAATQAALLALRIARSANVPSLRYATHLLLGHIAEAYGNLDRAARRYRAAAAAVERVQRGLTITLRPGFLEDKGEALRDLIRLHLRRGRITRAFEALERAKSQALLGYLANREQLRWASDDPRSQALIDELNHLREEHHWFYRLAYEQFDDAARPKSAITPQQAIAEVSARERQMRALTERLYLYTGDDRAINIVTPRLADVRGALDDDTLLIEFYSDGDALWAFTLDQHTLDAHRLPAAVGEVGRLLAQLQTNIASALGAGPGAPTAPGLANLARRILQRLHTALVAPIAHRVGTYARLVVVPYGALHYLPFHLLHDSETYLIERHEVVILPAAGLAARHGPARPRGARILAHSWNGRLAATQVEAGIVHRLFGGQIYAEHAARRTALSDSPTQILHIAAHGEHRLDQPDLSYIQLADGQLYTDDLLQHDMSYELVTLSACETGRANVAAGDELIGLGRGFLYAGAGALIASLWQVADESAIPLMEQVYRALQAGVSKAAALRHAQRAALIEHPLLHPAFWGAFQLVGDPGPLSPYPCEIT